MNKIISLIKVAMSEDMNIFKINTKKNTVFSKIFLPIILGIFLMSLMCTYSITIIEQLNLVNMEFVLLSLFVIFTSVLTIVEGIYKSGNLLFNCKDDNLLLSLPISKNTVLFIRVLKFYIFELIYNSLFIIPAIGVYAAYMKPSAIYYLVSAISLLLFPIIPILISCIIGTLITSIASRFKGKNIAQIILTLIFILGIMYISYNIDELILKIANSASTINDFITKLYYPAGAYIKLIQDFNILDLLEFISINILLLILTIILIGKLFFKINSSTKAIKTNKLKKQYTIKTTNPIWALIKKEFSRFVSSTVFITNAGFALVLYILGCIFFVIKYDSVMIQITEYTPNITSDYLNNCIPIIVFGFLCFSSFMTSITSSMISLEGKSINILKSLPIEPYTIIKSKVFAAILMMIPCLIIGDIIVFIKFKFDIFSMVMILVASVLLPLLSETIGILVNLKYPRMDAKNDTEVVKQSLSSTISVFIGLVLTALTVFLLYKVLEYNISTNIVLITFISVFGIIYAGLLFYLKKTSIKSFNNISV